MKHEYEIIFHEKINYKIFVVSLIYRTPHIHKDFEIGLLLDGDAALIMPERELHVEKGGIYVLNPFQRHELKANHPVTILSIQLSPAIFADYFPQLSSLDFTSTVIQENDDKLKQEIIDLALCYYEKKEWSELKCVGKINLLFASLLEHIPYRIISEKERLSFRLQAKRLQSITDYIAEHYCEKLLLSEIAEQEGLSLSYLSHFFKDFFGISFQDYLQKKRCEKARQLLLLTDHSLLDICISCGFSDVKYFNRGFKKQFGCNPKQYRKNFFHEKLEVIQSSMLTTQEFLSDRTSIVALQKFMDGN